MNSIKKGLSIVLAVMMLLTAFPLTAMADTADLSGTFNNGVWSISNDSMLIECDGDITTTTAIDSNNNEYTFAELVAENNVTSLTISSATALCNNFLYDEDYPIDSLVLTLPDTLVTIGDYAFYGVKMKSVTIPEGVEAIGDYAFAKCDIAGDDKRKMTFPDSVKTIGKYAFRDNYLCSVEIGRGIEVIDIGAFYNNPSLNKVRILNGNVQLNVKDTSAVLPDGSTRYSISDGPFGWYLKDGYVKRMSTGLIIEVFGVSDSVYEYTHRFGFTMSVIDGSEYLLDGERITGYSNRGKWYYYPETKDFYYKLTGVHTNTTLYYDDGTPVQRGELDVDNVIICYGASEIRQLGCLAVLEPKTIILPKSLKKIDYQSFTGLTLEYLDIPENVSILSNYAFENCNIKAVSFSTGLRIIPEGLFKGNKALEYVDFGWVSEIGKEAFKDCTALQEIYIPDNIYRIKESAFANCLNVKSITLHSNEFETGNIYIYPKAFANIPLCDTLNINCNLFVSWNIDGKVATSYYNDILNYEYAKDIFKGLGASTTGVVLTYDGEDLKIRNTSAYSEQNIVEINIGDSVILDDAPTPFPYLKRINCSENNEKYFVYNDCLYEMADGIVALWIASNNENVELHPQIVDIIEYGFKDKKLEHIVIPEGVEYIGCNAFQGCTQLRTVTLPSTISIIHGQTFEDCKKLKVVTIPSAEKIYYSAFDGCTNLSSIVLPSNLNRIFHNAFANCTSLKGVVIPECCQKIDKQAFMNCSSLTDVYIRDAEFTETTFENCDNITIHTPVGSVAYQLALEYGLNVEAYSDPDLFADTCAMKEDIYEGYLGFCEDGHGDIQYLTVYEPSCTQDGYIIGVCEYCSVILEEQHITAQGHTYENTVNIAPTSNTKGLQEYRCTTCHDTYKTYTPPLINGLVKSVCNVTGKVVIANDSDATKGSTPLKAVDIKLNGETLATTDKNGNFSFKLETGTYELVVHYSYGFDRTVYLVVNNLNMNMGTIPVIACDWNKDGVIDDDDYTLFRYVVGSSSDSPSYLSFVDMNNDGKINVKDLVYMNNVKGLKASEYVYPNYIVGA